MFVASALWGSANAIRWEQESGTLEALWSTPTSRVDILIGTSISETIWSTINIVIQLTILTLFLRLRFDMLGAFISIGVVVLTIIGLYGFGILFAGIVLVFKEPGTLTDLVETGFSILTPVRYSLQALPSFARYISLLIPFTLGLSVIRKLMVPNIVLFPYLETFYFVLGLILLDALLWGIGYILFTKMESYTREKGTLGSY
jgi:ABC-2 type transport system permease protein